MKQFRFLIELRINFMIEYIQQAVYMASNLIVFPIA